MLQHFQTLFFMSVSIACKSVFQQSFRAGGLGESVCGNATFTACHKERSLLYGKENKMDEYIIMLMIT